ncbi:MAG: HD domain-containing protein [Crocinitomicaceae bacterium]|nr:HD domain-containing protein [Crocinitomicaceae bacterium]MDG1657152.1 HD domain-containing protein [Crocinitomicaceae bacterium]
MKLQSKVNYNNKKKIVNDPVYGFITISQEIIFDVIEHPYFQRLRRIKQLGLTHLVYPGAIHTRFHHVIGAMHLMQKAIAIIRKKGHDVTESEERAVLFAILLHDIGHGPFSHALEHDIVSGVSHEEISSFFIERLSEEFDGELDLALQVFQDKYPKKFLHQLVSSQLDMDRMDYLNRDSFFTGVSEGVIGSDRIIEMLNVQDGDLVIEEKGIYSIEKFIVARRLMYWQVYLHKTVVAAEFMLIHVLRRAKELAMNGTDLFGSPALLYFLTRNVSAEDFKSNPNILDKFAALDDFDIFGAIKVWQSHEDPTLSELSKRLVQRDLFKIEISREPFSEEKIAATKKYVMDKMNIPSEQIQHFVYTDQLTNNAYNIARENINLLMKNGAVIDVSEASDNLNISALSNPVEKYLLCYPIFKGSRPKQFTMIKDLS